MTRETKIVLLVLGLVFGSIGVACAGCAGLVWWGWGQMEEEIVAQIRTNPVVLEHVGEVRSCEMDLAASLDEEEVEVFWFDVAGAKGEGRIWVRSVTRDDGAEEVVAGELRTSAGTYDLFGAPGDPPEADR